MHALMRFSRAVARPAVSLARPAAAAAAVPQRFASTSGGGSAADRFVAERMPKRALVGADYVDRYWATIFTELEALGMDETLANVNRLRKAGGKVAEASLGLSDFFLRNVHNPAITREPVRVVITGGAGAIAYAAAFRVAAGAMLGPNQPVELRLLEITPALPALQGVAMELQDCAFPLLRNIVTTDDPKKAFEGAQYALLIGAKPRTKGMERADLLKGNAKIFSEQGKAMNAVADVENIRVLVVGNPANTNALIAAANAPKISPRRITAMTRLDHNRGVAQLAAKSGARVNDISQFAIWGNHSSTMYPDITSCLIAGKPATQVVDAKWVQDTFEPTVKQRGAAIIAARGASSAASAANAAIDHMRDWALGSSGNWVSMGIPSDGSYGIAPGVVYSYPVVCANGDYTIVQNIEVPPRSAQAMKATRDELLAEKNDVAELL